MKSKLVIGFAMFVAAIVSIYYLNRGTPTTAGQTRSLTQPPNVSVSSLRTIAPQRTVASLPPPAEAERERAIWNEALMTPIYFYGKVVDQTGSPVKDAKVDLSFDDHLGAGNTKIQQHSDNNGLFAAAGRGLGVVVMVSKEGYRSIKESTKSFGYAAILKNRFPRPDASNPAIFTLEKMGDTEPLVAVETNILIRTDGSPVEVDLATGRTNQQTSDSLKIELWSQKGDQVNAKRNEPYDWKCHITVPNGGLVERTGYDEREAPENGYKDGDNIDMPASFGSAWRSQQTRKYFVRLVHSKYASIDLTVVAGSQPFVSIKSYLNPSGHRNLELDPRKTLKARP